MLNLNWVVFKRRTIINYKQERVDFYFVVEAMILVMAMGFEVGFLRLKQYILCLKELFFRSIYNCLFHFKCLFYKVFNSFHLSFQFWSFTFRDETKHSFRGLEKLEMSIL